MLTPLKNTLSLLLVIATLGLIILSHKLNKHRKNQRPQTQIIFESGILDNDSDIDSGKSSTSTCSQAQRFSKLSQMCSRYPEMHLLYSENKSQTFDRLFVNDKHKVMFCAMPKAGSTTFYNLFYYSITGKFNDNIHCEECWKKVGLKFLSEYSRAERTERLREYYKVLVVRHPLDRMVSCWNGKFVRPGMHQPWKSHGPRILQYMRGLKQTDKQYETEAKKGIKFSEFIEYILHLETIGFPHNEHWKPHYRMCHPCHIQYDLIVKLETMDLDSGNLIQKLELNQNELPLINARRKFDNRVELEHQLPEYVQIIDRDMEQLKSLLRFDMELFDYHWNDTTRTATCGKMEDNQCC